MTIVAAPDELRDQIRNLTRMQPIRTCAASPALDEFVFDQIKQERS